MDTFSLAPLFQPEHLISLFTLTILEVALGVDNIIFISILAAKLPQSQQKTARFAGLSLAVLSRLALLGSIVWLTHLTQPLFTLMGHTFSAKDLVLLLGGVFLIYKSAQHIFEKVEAVNEPIDSVKAKTNHTFFSVISQIILIDMVFSIDSIMTAVGIVEELSIMVLAILIALLFMMFGAELISHFIEKHPSLKVLALSFLLMIGTTLVAESFGAHIPKEYLYFSVGFALLVEVLNISTKTRKQKQQIT